MWKRAKIPYFPPFLIHGTWWENGKGFHSGGGGKGFPHGFHVESTGNCGRWCFALASANYLFMSPTAPFLSIAKERGERTPAKTTFLHFLSALRNVKTRFSLPHVHANLPVSFRQRSVSATAPLPLTGSTNNDSASTVAAHERQRRRKKVSSSYGSTTVVLCERVVYGITNRKP